MTANETLQLKHKRILILGCPGSGKTTFAKQINQQLQLPLFGMDELYWLKGWLRPSEDNFKKKLRAVLAKPEWIIEGNYFRYLQERLEAAEAVILLQEKSSTCLYRVIKRALVRRKQTVLQPFRLSVAIKLMLNILSFSKKTLPKMLTLFEKSTLPIYVVNIKKVNTC